jgi:hypothetical protein
VNVSSESSAHISSGFALGYLYKTIKDELNSISAKTGGKLSAVKLAGWLAEILSTETGGSKLGDPERVLEVWRNSTKGNAITPEEEVHVRTHERRPLSKKARRAISLGQKRRWAKQKGKKPHKHWTQLPKNKAKMMSNIKAMHKAA